ncbi:MAG: hypothetical protein ACXABY_11025, partial [Candidatus Thorarchaeota archaeon]
CSDLPSPARGIVAHVLEGVRLAFMVLTTPRHCNTHTGCLLFWWMEVIMEKLENLLRISKRSGFCNISETKGCYNYINELKIRGRRHGIT